MLVRERRNVLHTRQAETFPNGVVGTKSFHTVVVERANTREILVSEIFGHKHMAAFWVQRAMHTLTVDNQAYTNPGSDRDVAKRFAYTLGKLSLLVLIQRAHIDIRVNKDFVLVLSEPVGVYEVFPHGHPLPSQFGGRRDASEVWRIFVQAEGPEARNADRFNIRKL